MSRSYKQMIDRLVDGINKRQHMLRTPRLNDEFPSGMDAVEAALQAIDDLTEELESLRKDPGGTEE